MTTSVVEQTTGEDHQLVYPGVSSCMTITCVLSNGDLVGGHFTLFTTSVKTTQMLQEMVNKTTGKSIRSIYLVGFVEAWKQPTAAELAYPAAMVAKLRGIFKFVYAIFAYDIAQKSANAVVKVTNKGDGKAYVEWRDTPRNPNDQGLYKEIFLEADPARPNASRLPSRIGIADMNIIDQSSMTSL